eukprot:483834-Pleurochrysis_carterae.AAC.3
MRTQPRRFTNGLPTENGSCREAAHAHSFVFVPVLALLKGSSCSCEVRRPADRSCLCTTRAKRAFCVNEREIRFHHHDGLVGLLLALRPSRVDARAESREHALACTRTCGTQPRSHETSSHAAAASHPIPSADSSASH